MSLTLTQVGGATLQTVAAKVAHIPGALPRIAAQVGNEAVARVQLGFRRESDPYGNPWKPHVVPRVTIVQKSRNVFVSSVGKILQNKGLLRASFGAKVEGTKVTLGAGGPGGRWADVHQRGRVIVPRKKKALYFNGVFAKRVVIPARAMVPTKLGGMPAKWSLGFVSIARAVMREVMK